MALFEVVKLGRRGEGGARLAGLLRKEGGDEYETLVAKVVLRGEGSLFSHAGMSLMSRGAEKGSGWKRGERRFARGDPFDRVREWLRESDGGDEDTPGRWSTGLDELGTEKGNSGAYAELELLWPVGMCVELFGDECEERVVVLKGLARTLEGFDGRSDLSSAKGSGSPSYSSSPAGDGVFLLVAMGVAGS